MQIPFWFGWSTVLANRNVLRREDHQYLLYIAGIGLGTLIGHCIFIFGGKLLVDSLNARQDVIHWSVGGIFLLTAIIQWVKMVKNKDAISKMSGH
jgi:putative Ca2+/H+ antiporter (TMEM165/GDT1 family)